MIIVSRVILVAGNLGWRDSPLDARKWGGTEDTRLFHYQHILLPTHCIHLSAAAWISLV
jgi:hypothetical protein